MTVDIGDLTFAESTGSLTHSGQEPVSSMPYGAYGVAMSCTGGPDGIANIDLRETPFAVTDTFRMGGFAADGSEDRSADGQLINLNGGGFCGWIAPDPPAYNPFNPQPGDFRLELDCSANMLSPSGLCVRR